MSFNNADIPNITDFPKELDFKKGNTIRGKYGAKTLFSHSVNSRPTIIHNSLYGKTCHNYIGIYTSQDIHLSPMQCVELIGPSLKNPGECTFTAADATNDSGVYVTCIYFIPHDNIHLFIQNKNRYLDIPKNTLIIVIRQEITP